MVEFLINCLDENKFQLLNENLPIENNFINYMENFSINNE
jgi:hypothetical protein